MNNNITVEEENRLGRWVHELKMVYKNKRRYIISQERIKKLEKIKGWQWGGLNLNEIWNKKFEQLKHWIKQHNGIYPQWDSKNIIEKKLNIWCNSQRNLCRKGVFISKSKEFIEMNKKTNKTIRIFARLALSS